MRKFFYLFSGILALILLFLSTRIMAQNPNMDRYITMMVKDGKDISLYMSAELDNTPIKIVSGDSTYHYSAKTTLEGPLCKAHGNVMTIYGDVQVLSCGDNEGSLFGTIDASHNKQLLELWCYNNAITSVNISGCEKLRACDVGGNQLSACGLDSLFKQLPIRQQEDKGDIYIKDDALTNPGTSGCRDTIATNRNWMVLDAKGDIPIINTNYTCSENTNIEFNFVDDSQICTYPNPIINELFVGGLNDVVRIEVYDEACRVLITSHGAYSIDCASLDGGIYFVRIFTKDNSYSKKFVKL